MRQKKRQSSNAGFISLVALLLAIATSAVAQSESAAREVFKGSNEFHKRLERTDSSVEKYVDDLDKTMHSLLELARSDRHVQGRYGSYSKSLRKLEKSQARAASDIDDMRAAGTEYFSRWGNVILGITDPELRQRSQEEHKRLTTQYEIFSERISSVAVSLPSIMGRFRDLNAFLGADATGQNARRASETVRLCKAEFEDLKNKIGDARSTLRQLLNEAPK